MKKFAVVLTALVAAFMLMGGTAEAAKKKTQVVVQAPWYWWWTAPWTVRDPKLAGSNFVVGAGATATYFAIRPHHHHAGTAHHGLSSGAAYVGTSAACAAVSPIVGTIVTQRHLTQREVFVSTANCFAPIVGGWAMNYWFDYYGWDRPKGKKG